AREVMAGNLILKRWDQAIEQEIGRINTVAAAFPEYEIPSIGEEERLLLLIQICDGGLSYKQIKDRAVKTAIAEWLPPHQYRLLDQFAPERIELSSGRSVKIFYDPDPAVKPKISVLIQHLFKVRETPTIANGRVPLLIEILAPNSRPVQVTEDLAGFWKGSYAGVRTMLRGRYPKHDWPEPES
ncbi:MAG: ATP-dependent helicase C-terminal domain-containing protein, partial [Verrucomicrobiales bacterium]